MKRDPKIGDRLKEIKSGRVGILASVLYSDPLIYVVIWEDDGSEEKISELNWEILKER